MNIYISRENVFTYPSKCYTAFGFLSSLCKADSLVFHGSRTLQSMQALQRTCHAMDIVVTNPRLNQKLMRRRLPHHV